MSIRWMALRTSRTATLCSAYPWRLEYRGGVRRGATGIARECRIYDPTRDELFTAEQGRGAQLNGEPIHVSKTR